MKRIISGFAAIAIAATLAAFTPVGNAGSLTDAVFEFDSSLEPTLDNVQDESNWIKVTDMTGCASGISRACKIKVTSAHYSGNTLSSSANLQATETSTDVARVTGGNTVEIVNRANP